MDIQPAGDKLLNLTLQNLQTAQNEQLTLIARLTGMTTQNTSKASVIDVANLSPEDRAILVAQIDKALAQIKTNTLLPTAQQQIEALEQQQKLLQSNLLKLITLEVNNKTFLVYSNQALVKGQEISLRFIPNIGLELLNTPDDIPELTNTEKIIAQNLRQLLPLISHLPGQKHDNFFSALSTLNDVVSKIPEQKRDALIDKPLKNSLDAIIQLIPTLAKVTDPKILKTIIEHSGIQFEKRLIESLTTTVSSSAVITQKIQLSSNLAQSVKTAAPAMETPPPLPLADKIPSGQALTTQNLSPLLSHQMNNVAQSTMVNLRALSYTLKPEHDSNILRVKDIKGALVNLVTSTTQTLAEESSEKESIIQSLNNIHLKDWVIQLIPILMGKTPHKDLSIKTLRTQLIALLQQHAYQAVAKIQIQQLQSVQPQNTQTDYPQQSWQIDIPIRYQQDIHPLHMQIERYWIDDKEKSTEHKREKVKQWRIMLNFDLPLIGHFYAQLIWFNQQLSATLWAEKADTLKIAKEKMENLRTKLQEEGIIVTQLDCLVGAPNKPQNEIHYSLIDIKT